MKNISVLALSLFALSFSTAFSVSQAASDGSTDNLVKKTCNIQVVSTAYIYNSLSGITLPNYMLSEQLKSRLQYQLEQKGYNNVYFSGYSLKNGDDYLSILSIGQSKEKIRSISVYGVLKKNVYDGEKITISTGTKFFDKAVNASDLYSKRCSAKKADEECSDYVARAALDLSLDKIPNCNMGEVVK